MVDPGINAERAAFRAEIALKNREIATSGQKVMPILVTLNGYQLDPILVPIRSHPRMIEDIVRQNTYVRDALRGNPQHEMTYSPVSGRMIIVTNRTLKEPRMATRGDAGWSGGIR